MTAKSARKEILEDIRRALHGEGKAGPLRGEPVPSAPSDLDQLISEIKKDCEQRRGELIEQFESELTRVGGRFHRATTAESAFQYIEQVASVRQAKRIIAWETKVIDDIDLSGKLEEKGIEVLTETADREFIPAAASSDVGVFGFDLVFADTGTMG